MKKKIIFTSLIVLMIMFYLISCSANGGVDTENDAEPPPNDPAFVEIDEVVEVTAETILASLPDADYGGYTFTILTSNRSHGDEFEWRQAPEETETGEPINDALFRRARLIEEQYNINFEYVIENNVGNKESMTQRTVRSGDDAFDIVIGEMIGVTRSLAQSGAVQCTGE